MIAQTDSPRLFPSGTEPSLLLLDGNNLIYRAYYALARSRPLTAPDGTPTGALHAFFNMLLKILQTIRPTHLCAAFDRAEPTFRHQLDERYKAQRQPTPPDLRRQIPILRELLPLFGVPCLDLAGYEADDLMGTLADRAAPDMPVWIVTGDKDCFQLVSDRITVLQPVTRSGGTETDQINPQSVWDRYQIRPDQMIELKALMGDPSDNIPGVRGIGEKGASALIAEHGTLEGVYAALPEMKGALASKLAAGQADAFLSRKLATIDRAAPLEIAMDDLRAPEPDLLRLTQRLNELGFKSLLNRLNLSVEPLVLQSNEGLSTAHKKETDKPPVNQLPVMTTPVQHESDRSPALFMREGTVLVIGAGQKQSQEYAVSDPALKSLANPADPAWLFADLKGFLRLTGQTKWPAEVFDVTVAGQLLNQIEGRPDLDRLHRLVVGTGLESLPDEPVAAEITALRQIHAAQLHELKSRNDLNTLFEDIEMPLTTILANMEQRGFRIDLAMLDQLADELELNLMRLQTEIFDLCGCTFNISSTRQLSDVLYGTLGLKPGKKRTGGSFSTDIDELNRLVDKHPVIPLIMEHRQYAKLRSTYVEGLRRLISSDGRVHTTFNQMGASTGRLSSTEPNLQNIPVRTANGREIRRAFIAADGHVLIDADYSQIELRLLAHLSGDANMIQLFVSGEDIHNKTASRLFDVAPDRVTPVQRNTAKTMNFSIIYGISDFGLARDLGVGLSVAHRYIAEYDREYPQIRPYLARLLEQAKACGYAETMFGRRRFVPELKAQNRNVRQFGERAAMNMPIQGTAADLIKIAMVRCDQTLKEQGLSARLILQVHDELIVEAPEHEAEQAARILRLAMEQAATLTVPLVAEVAIGKSWAECK